MSSNQKLSLFFGMALVIAGIGFLIGQGNKGAGVPVVILLSSIWTFYSVRRWGKQPAG